jgi:signal peptidase I
VLIGSKPLDEPYVKFLEASYASGEPDLRQDDPRGNWGPQTVPPDMYFVLGDNRDNSRDSRFWGFVPQEDLLGRAAVVYWSYDATREEHRRTKLSEWVRDTLSSFGRTRWERIGRRLK